MTADSRPAGRPDRGFAGEQVGVPAEGLPHAPGPRLLPAERLHPDPRRDRRWRLWLIAVAAVIVGVVLLLLAGRSLVTWYVNRDFTDIPATYELGAPDSLAIDSETADIRVVRDEAAQDVTLALVDHGSSTLPDPGTEVRAMVESAGSASSPALRVRQPRNASPVPWEASHHDLLLVIPTSMDLSLDLVTGVGDVDVDGEFARLAVTSDVGDVALRDIVAPEGVSVRAEVGDTRLQLAAAVPAGVEVTSEVGDIEVHLAPDASGDLDLVSEVGDIQVRVPGTAVRDVATTVEAGSADVSPGIDQPGSGSVGRLRATSSVGDVTISR